MIDILEEYKSHCLNYDIPFEDIQSIKSPDESTLFCSAGMQRFKNEFIGNSTRTIATNQKCLRVEDIDELGDGIHFGVFQMLGLFSFRDWSLEKTIKFWMEFMERLGVKVTSYHIHPDKLEWQKFYPKGRVVLDDSCKWSDGVIGGYCTEFYVNELEVGNIVNPLGDCIDVGFGLERLDKIVNKTELDTKEETIKKACLTIINEGYEPSNKKHGYVLRRLLRKLKDINIDVPFLKEEKERQEIIKERYKELKDRFPNKDKEWWFETHGIEIDKYE